MWITVALAGIALGALSLFFEHRKDMAQVRGDAGALSERLAAADAERARLRQRVEALEAIVTTETYDALRTDPTDARSRIDAGLLDPLPTPERPADEGPAPQRARGR